MRLGKSLKNAVGFGVIWIFGLIVGSLTLLAERPSHVFYDTFQNLTAQDKAAGTALILLDQPSMDRMRSADQLTFPYPREVFGAVASVAAKVGARAVVFDILFDEPSSHGAGDDESFAALIKDSKIPVFMAAVTVDGVRVEPVETLKSVIAGAGSTMVRVDADGVVRNFPILKNKEAGGASLDDLVYKTLEKSPSSGGALPAQNQKLRFYSKEAIPRASFYDVLRAYRLAEEGREIPEAISGLINHVWFVGYAAPGLYDLKPTPTDPVAPGVVVPATAFANRLEKLEINDFSVSSLVAILAATIFLTITVLRRVQTPGIATAILVLLTLGLPLLLASFAWTFGIWITPVPFIAGIFVSGISQTALSFQSQWRDRLKLAKSLEHSMSPEMVNLIRNGEVSVSRFGEERKITVFFCDLAGFTSLSEQLAPAELIEILNEYLDRGVSLIVGKSGYVDKFIGDAIMAFWGAPIMQSNHAELALETAIAFSDVVSALNDELSSMGGGKLAKLEVRIGLHTGSAVVGNIGARRRHNYTAIGDTVNLASRLEGLGKAYGCNLIISESVVESVSIAKHPGLYEVDRVTVKGRAAPVRIFSHFAGAQERPLSEYQLGLNHYYKGNWAEAIVHFEKAIQLPPAEELLSRCKNALTSGTPPQWLAGVWNHEHK